MRGSLTLDIAALYRLKKAFASQFGKPQVFWIEFHRWSLTNFTICGGMHDPATNPNLLALEKPRAFQLIIILTQKAVYE